MREVVIIPARYDSQRFPGKLLYNHKGQTILERCFNTCAKEKEVYIASGDEKILNFAERFTTNIIQTSGNHSCGTECVAEAVNILGLDINDSVINLQGDNIYYYPYYIDTLFLSLLEHPEFALHTLFYKRPFQDYANSNKIKILSLPLLNKGYEEVIYFSRCPIPHNQNHCDFKYHVGIYGYKVRTLNTYTAFKNRSLEKIENLEQLRFIENKVPVLTVEVERPLGFSIDTIEDLND